MNAKAYIKCFNKPKERSSKHSFSIFQNRVTFTQIIILFTDTCGCGQKLSITFDRIAMWQKMTSNSITAQLFVPDVQVQR